MIKDILEINFPEYATLSTATASLVDMGDKTITAQVKIDGSITPDFSYDWEIEFQGERYIQPLREPQASKGNESMSSTIDLTFYHKGIYDLKRYFFVSTVELEAGTLMADNYIVPLRLNIAEFVDYLNKVLSYYYGSTYKVYLNPDYEYDETDRKDIDINYTKIWDVISKTYEWFGVRWSWETQQDNVEYYYIKIGYPSTEISHTFEYGFEGGLLKFERQVQDVEIANVVFGRGSSENIPYRYFKNKSEDNPTFPADPDWIPELENVYFANLRGKTFRDYVQGWKTNPNRNTLDGTLPIEQLNLIKWTENEAYRKGHEDTTFNPIEYVKDRKSIAKYGEIQKGLEHNEEIKPTIQGVTIDGIGRVDQVVDVEEILVDESVENTEWESKVIDITHSDIVANVDINTSTYNIRTTSEVVEVPQGHTGRFIKDIVITAIEEVKCKDKYSNSSPQGDTFYPIVSHPLTVTLGSIRLIDEDTKEEITNIISIAGGTRFRIEYSIRVSNFLKDSTYTKENYPYYGVTTTVWRTVLNPCKIISSLSWQLDYTPVHGQILGNYEDGAARKSQTVTIASKGESTVEFTTEQFTITEKDAPATSVEMPYRITSSLKGGEYNPQPNVVAIDVNTGEVVSPINLPAGTYRLRNSIQIENISNKSQTFKVELLPTYIYYSYDSASWKPTFDIWVKNIWQTMPNKLEEDYTYEHRIWDAILGNHLGEEAKVVFSSGRLSGHSDWEFLIADTPKRDTSKTIDGVPSEWRITLYKSDAEVEATDKWLPSIMTQASAGDHFYFVGIEMPHQYVLWAEERLDKYKHDELDKVSNVKSTIVVQLDKIRVNQLQSNETRPLLDSLRIGNNIKVTDSRFIQSSHETLHLQSITYTWDTSTIMLPNIDVVLSDDVVTSTNLIKNIQHRVDDTIRSVDTLRTNSLVQINKAKKSIRDTNTSIKALSSGSIDMTNQVKALIGDDMWMSSREIAEDVVSKNVSPTLNPLEERVSTIVGEDAGLSMRQVAMDVLDDGSIENIVADAIAEEIERIDATYAKSSDIASLEDYTNEQLKTKFDKSGLLAANQVKALDNSTVGIARDLPVFGSQIKSLSANLLAGIQADEFYIEKNYGDGVWEMLPHDTPTIRGMFSDNGIQNGFTLHPNESWVLGSQFRITIYPKVRRNAWVDFFAISMYSNARQFNISTEYCARNDDGELMWNPIGTQANCRANEIVVIGYNGYFGFEAYNRWGIRFTFEITREYASTSRVIGISAYGNRIAEQSSTPDNAIWTIGKDYLPDVDKNCTFPEKVVARSFEDRDGNAVMLTKDIPTEVATATQRRLVTPSTPIIGIAPNIMYDWGSTSWLTSLSIPSLIDGDGSYDNKWMLRFTLSSSDNLSIGFDVFWKDGIAPTWSGWAICEITFYRDVDNTTTIGEWKIYK